MHKNLPCAKCSEYNIPKRLFSSGPEHYLHLFLLDLSFPYQMFLLVNNRTCVTGLNYVFNYYLNIGANLARFSAVGGIPYNSHICTGLTALGITIQRII